MGKELQDRLTADPLAVAEPAPGPQTVASRIGDFLSYRGGDISDAYRIGLEMHLKVLAGYGEHPIESLSRRDCEKIRKEILKNSRRRARVVQVTIRSFLKYAGRGDLVGVFKRIKVEAPTPMPFDDDELTRILDAAADPKLKLYIRAGATLGMAVIDLVNLTRPTAAKANRVLRYRRKKSGRPAIPPIPAELKADLLAAAGPDGYIFWDRRLTENRQIAVWIGALGAVLKAVGLHTKGNCTHRLRDTCAKYYFDRDTSVRGVALILGDLETTVQAHYSEWATTTDEQRISGLEARKI